MPTRQRQNLPMSRMPAANSTLAIGGVSSPLDSFVVTESSALRMSTCAEKPAHRQSPNHQTVKKRPFFSVNVLAEKQNRYILYLNKYSSNMAYLVEMNRF